MLTTVQERKLTYLFRIFDVDKNGTLESEDFEYVGQNICHALHLTPEMVDYDRIMRKCKDMYAYTICKISPGLHDPITLDSWLDFFGRSTENVIAEEFVNLTVEYVFETFDQNKDGCLTMDEYIEMFKIYGIDTYYSIRGFQEVDTNNNHVISRDELEHALKDFFTSSDPTARGNWVFGNWN